MIGSGVNVTKWNRLFPPSGRGGSLLMPEAEIYENDMNVCIRIKSKERNVIFGAS